MDNEFYKNDAAKFIHKKKEFLCTIQEVFKKNDLVDVWSLNKIEKIPLEQSEFPPVFLSSEQVRQLCRYEAKFSELTKGYPDYMSVFLRESYVITLDDFLTAIQNIRKSGDDNSVIKENWYNPIDFYIDEYSKKIGFENTPDSVQNFEYLPDRLTYICDVFDRISGLLSDEKPFCETAEQITEILTSVLENEKKPIWERSYSDSEKEHFITHMGTDDRLKKATKSELKLYRQFVDDLCSKNNITALKCKGYGCYGGNPAFDCDWNVSLKCMLKLFELTGNPMFANTLGYIYYYGRCWNGQPKYEEAFKYFSIGAAGGYYESRYKLADMFILGYGVPENEPIAYRIVEELYDQNIKYILDGNFDCKFADIAVRLGSYEESGCSGKHPNFHLAYCYYLQADFAIKRRLEYNYYGDLSVADDIRVGLNRILDSGKIRKPKKTDKINLSSMLYHYLKKYRKLQMKIKVLKNGDIKLSIRIAPFRDEKYPPKMFITNTETGFCGMLETLNISVKNAKIIGVNDIRKTIYFDKLSPYYAPNENIDEDYDSIGFILGDEIQAAVIGDFSFTNPTKVSNKKYRFASVYFSPGGKHYDYLLDIDGVNVGDTVIVITNRGETEVTVADILEKSESELALPISKYKNIVRKL